MSDVGKKQATKRPTSVPILNTGGTYERIYMPTKAEGTPVWHNVNPVRHSFPLPAESKGPINPGRASRVARKGKQTR